MEDFKMIDLKRNSKKIPVKALGLRKRLIQFISLIKRRF